MWGIKQSFALEPNRHLTTGGEGGIRTHGTVTRTPDFESGTFDHSATSPRSHDYSLSTPPI